MKKLAQYLRGWIDYFGISEYYRPILEIDHWLRRRVRMCHWKQWRYVRTRVRSLLKMGTHPNVAIPMSFSRKGPWKWYPDVSYANRYDQSMVERSRSAVCQRTMGKHSLPDYGPAT